MEKMIQAGVMDSKKENRRIDSSILLIKTR
jgi:hypothetical protein